VPLSGLVDGGTKSTPWAHGEHRPRLRKPQGKPLNPSNVRRDVLLPLKKRAEVQQLDLSSLRHTFASLGRTAGESAFNVARMMGHARSTLVDQVYAHRMQQGWQAPQRMSPRGPSV
jgi:integrase